MASSMALPKTRLNRSLDGGEPILVPVLVLARARLIHVTCSQVRQMLDLVRADDRKRELG